MGNYRLLLLRKEIKYNNQFKMKKLGCIDYQNMIKNFPKIYKKFLITDKKVFNFYNNFK